MEQVSKQVMLVVLVELVHQLLEDAVLS